jgi:hypothetical protein
MIVTADDTVVLVALVEVAVVEVPVVDVVPVVLIPVALLSAVLVSVVPFGLAVLLESNLKTVLALTGAGVAAAAPESVVDSGEPRLMMPRP